MPEGKDFMDELETRVVVGAVAGTEESSGALPAGLLRPRRNKRCIASDAPYAGCAQHVGDAT